MTEILNKILNFQIAIGVLIIVLFLIVFALIGECNRHKKVITDLEERLHEVESFLNL